MKKDFITPSDAAAFGYCMKGIRAVCKEHGFDFRKFIKDGISFEDAANVPDARLHKLIEHVKERQNGEG